MKNLWMPDATAFASQEGFEKVIYRTFDIERYLNIDDGDNLFFLIGPKGVGKTHLLLCKSFLYHNAEKGYKYNVDSKQLVEYVSFKRNTLSQEDLLKFSDPELWKNIWTLCLMVVALKSAEINLPAILQRKLEGLLGNSSQISSMLWNIFNNRSKMHALVNFIGELGAYLSEIKSGVAVFVDNVDQAFEDIIIEARTHYGVSGEMINAATETWVNAQMGLLDAIFDLCTRNNHLKMFATIRIEAFRIDRPRGRNYESHGVKLHYDKEDIQRILNNRIKVLSSSELVDPNKKSPIGRLLGFEKMPHRYYKNPDDSVYEEEIFEFLYRHTYGRPREIVDIGERLNRLIFDPDYRTWDEKKKQDKVREVVNEEATRFFERYKQEIIPYFDEEQFDVFVKTLRFNVFSKHETMRFDAVTLDLYYNLGLLGHAQNRPDGMAQIFRDFSNYEFGRKRKLPPAEFYFIHPTLIRTLMEAKNYDVLDQNHLIGPNLPFIPPIDFPVLLQEPKIEYYKPHKVVGNRWENSYQRQSEPLKNYYDAYFIRLDDVLYKLLASFEKSFLENFNAIHYCSLADIHLRRHGEMYRKAYDMEQKRFQIGSAQKTGGYQTELPHIDENIDNARSRFGHRLYGRLITLGCCFFTEMTCSEIHSLLQTNEELTFGIKNHDENKFQFLKTAFFIEGLSDFKSKGRSHETLQYIFDELSLYEQKILADWRGSLEYQILRLDWILPEHKSWVSDTWLPGIWRPNLSI